MIQNFLVMKTIKDWKKWLTTMKDATFWSMLLKASSVLSHQKLCMISSGREMSFAEKMIEALIINFGKTEGIKKILITECIHCQEQAIGSIDSGRNKKRKEQHTIK